MPDDGLVSISLIATTTVPWIPAAHTLELALTRQAPSSGQVTSAFAFVLDASDRMLLTCVDRPGRGWDIPGGHLEPGESPTQAAARELAEETGFALDPSSLELFGWHRIEITGPVPSNYPYALLTYMLSFTARLAIPGPPTAPPAGTESTHAEWLTRAEIESRCAHRTWLPLYQALVA